MVRGFTIFVILGIPAVTALAETDVFFEEKIRPVLAEKCYKCHSSDAEKLKAGLMLDHREHMLAGGDTGPSIEPGNVEASLLIEAIRYGNDDLQMPPKGKLSDEIIRDFERWIVEGAVWPDEPVPERGEAGEKEAFDLEKRRAEHWSWRPVRKPELPEVSNGDWSRESLDRFILAKVEAAGLEPAAEADRAIWLRRIYFDVIGLPPTPAQLNAFLTDESDDSFEKVVDGLLASPHFGEKWARHWMDLVRYAETYGHEFDYPINYAHEYRDYLIRALNADIGYDQFIREHVAGDLLVNQRRNPEAQFDESILGTAFWYLHEATHAPTDVLANEADIMANQIDVFGKTFLGLTISCARCHDHKFDAISTADYYAMTAFLHGSARQEAVIDEGRMREQTRAELIALKRKADALLPDSRAKSEDGGAFEDFADGVVPEGWTASGTAFAGSGTRSGIRFDAADPLTTPGTVDSGLFGKEQVGVLRSPTFEIETDFIHVLLKGKGVGVTLVIDNYQMAKFSALLFKGTFENKVDTKGEFAWVTLGRDLKKYKGSRAYLEFADTGDGAMVLDEIQFSMGEKAPSVPELATKAEIPEGVMELVRDGEKLAAGLPKPRFAIAMAEGTRENARVYVRGNPRAPGEEVPPRILESLGGDIGSRLDLAEQIADPDNPLTSRVVANRIWHHLFGRGIVATVDDFGPMGMEPSHPELLDWLAADFVESGWSIKQTIRKIVLSSTYRQSSLSNPAIPTSVSAEVDPDNVMLSRMPVRRLPAESIRDSILMVSGQLDPAMFGPAVATHRTAFMTGRGGRESGPLDGAGRRSIYGATYRNFLSPFMLTFDAPGPFGPKGRRSVSNVPAQALVLMNDPFVVEQSRKWGERMAVGSEPIGAKVDTMYLTAVGRKPTEFERLKVLGFLNTEAESEVQKWADLAHVLFNTKDFIFLN